MTRKLADLVGGHLDRSWLASVPAGDLLRASDQEGVTSLVTLALSTQVDLPADLSKVFRNAATREAVVDAVHEPMLRSLVQSLTEAGVDHVLIKGVHLAYAFYASPHLRPRVDVDVLITPERRSAAEAALAGLGYVKVPQVTGDLVMYQVTFEHRMHGMPPHAVDLHWRLTNPQVFGQMLSFEEIRAEAVPLAQLAPAALVPGIVHALVIACVHRVVHHANSSRLIWLVDIDRLMREMTPSDWDAFTSLASARHVGAICASGVEGAAQLFGSPVPGSVLSRLRTPDTSAAARRTESYLQSDRPHIAEVMQDLQAMRSWRDRARLVAQHVFPSIHYMRDVYAPHSRTPLLFLYVHRMWRGARRWVARA